MSIQERKAIWNAVSLILVFAILWMIFQPRWQAATSLAAQLRVWSSFILFTLLAQLLAGILVVIIFNLVSQQTHQETEPTTMDERDQVIELRATRNFAFVFSGAVLGALAILALGLAPVSAFYLLALGILAAGLSLPASYFFFYRRGY